MNIYFVPRNKHVSHGKQERNSIRMEQKSKGMSQVLYELGWMNPSLLNSVGSTKYSRGEKKRDFDDDWNLLWEEKQYYCS